MKAWHVLLVVVLAVAGFFAWRRYGRGKSGAVVESGPVGASTFRPATTIPQTPVRQVVPPKPVSIKPKPASTAAKLSGAARSVATSAIRNSGIPGASLVAKPGGAVAAKTVSIASKGVKKVFKLFG